MTDLRKAAEMALKAMGGRTGESWLHDMEQAKEALRQALAQAEQKKEQEPEWIDDGFGTMWKKCGKKDCGKFVVKIGKVDCWNGDCPEATAPPKREWVGITYDEVYEFVCTTDSYINLARAIEAKLKEKNSG